MDFAWSADAQNIWRGNPSSSTGACLCMRAGTQACSGGMKTQSLGSSQLRCDGDPVAGLNTRAAAPYRDVLRNGGRFDRSDALHDFRSFASPLLPPKSHELETFR